MVSYLLLLCISLWGCSFGYNIETRIDFPLYLRDGGTLNPGEKNGTSFAAYSFDAVQENGIIKIIVGQPRDGDKETSTGAIYFCNVTHLITTTPVTTIFSASTQSSPNVICDKAIIFDQNNINQRGMDHHGAADAFGLSVTRVGGEDGYMVCSSTRQRKCGKREIFSPGACYIGNGDDWNYQEWPKAKCFKETIDIIFIVDGSKSITLQNFKIVKRWLIEVIKSVIDTFGDAVRTEVIQYSNESVFAIPYKFGDCVTVECVTNEIKNMSYLNGHTYTDGAIHRSMKEFGSDVTTEKLAVVLTDGQASDGITLRRTHDKFKSTVTFIAVGVGDYAKFMKQLRQIANGDTGNDRVLTVENFALLEGIIGNLVSEIEKSVFLEGVGATLSSNDSDQLSPQLGSSIASTEDGTLYVGAIGMYQGSGNVLKYDNRADATPDVPTYQEIQQLLQTHETSASYFGFAMTTGFFDGRTSVEYVAVGAPRYMMIGAVIVYAFANNSTLRDSVKVDAPATVKVRKRDGSISNEPEFGSYFGGCVLALDLNNDGLDDLLVGAPLHIGSSFDEGRVFVYVSSGVTSYREWNESKPLEIYGERLPGGRFGTSMSGAGDLNDDGYNDVVIGAPLTDAGHGAVFIYHGSADGIDVVSKQKILASSFGGWTLEYFGQSVQGNIDVNGDRYPDVLIGAPKSDSLVILRSRPIVKIHVSLNFTTESLGISDCIKKSYQGCTSLRICFIVNGTSIEPLIALQGKVTIDSSRSPLEKRLVFREELDPTRSGSFVTNLNISTPGSPCFEETLNMKTDISDYTSTIVAELGYDLTSVHRDKPFSSVLDKSLPTSQKKVLEFVNECESEICIHDLGIKTALDLPDFVIDGKDLTDAGKILIINRSTAPNPPAIRINLTNTGEIAYNTRAKVTYSSRMGLSSIIHHSAYPPSTSCVVTEDEPFPNDNYTNVRILRYSSSGSIMPSDSWCYFSFNFSVDSLKTDAVTEGLFARVTAYTSSNSSFDNDTSDNSGNVSFKINYVSDFDIRRETVDAERTLNETTNIEENITSVYDIGRGLKNIDMNFTVIGYGYAILPEAKITLTWPWISDAGDPLLYLFALECEPVGGSTRTTCFCDRTNVNPYNLTQLEEIEVNSTFFGNETSNRTTSVIPATSFINDTDCYSDIKTHNHTCQSLVCTIKNLGSSDKVRFAASFRLWIASITFQGTNRTQLDLKSRFEVSTEGSPLILSSDGENVTVKAIEITTKAKKLIRPQTESPSDTTWILVVALTAGFLTLVLIVLIMYLAGFFTSKFAKLREIAEKDLEDSEEINIPVEDGGSDFETVTRRLWSFSGDPENQSEVGFVKSPNEEMATPSPRDTESQTEALSIRDHGEISDDN